MKGPKALQSTHRNMTDLQQLIKSREGTLTRKGLKLNSKRSATASSREEKQTETISCRREVIRKAELPSRARQLHFGRPRIPKCYLSEVKQGTQETSTVCRVD